MTRSLLFVSTFLMFHAVGSASLSADRAKLRSGKSVDGSFVSADSTRVKILLANGSLVNLPIGDLTGVEFTPRKAETPQAPAQAPAQAPDPARQPAPVTVPSG